MLDRILEIWMKVILILMGIIVTLSLLGASLTLSICLDSWWFMFINLGYLILGPALIAMWQGLWEMN